MDLGEMIELMKEEVMLGADFSQIDFLFDNTAMALAEPVSYTHLDVYKRQSLCIRKPILQIGTPSSSMVKSSL